MSDDGIAPVHVYQAYIRAPAERVWDAIVNGDVTVDYFYRTRVQSTWEPGAPIRYTMPDGSLAADGSILAIEPGKRVEMTFVPRWDPDLTAEGGAREAWLVEAQSDDLTRLTVEIYDLPVDSKTLPDFIEGLPLIVSGLKTLLETGAPLQR